MERKQIEAALKAVRSRGEETKRDIQKYSSHPGHPTVLTLNNIYGTCVVLSEMLSAMLDVTTEDSADV